MSDRTIYLEEEHALPDGTKQLAIHNLQQPDVDIIRTALAMKRTNNVELLRHHGSLSDTTTTRLRTENERIDNISMLMHLIR